MSKQRLEISLSDFDSFVEESRQISIREQGLEELESAYRRDQGEAVGRVRLLAQIMIRNARHLLMALEQLEGSIDCSVGAEAIDPVEESSLARHSR